MEAEEAKLSRLWNLGDKAGGVWETNEPKVQL